MNILKNLSKSGLLAAFVFWIIISSEDFETDLVPFILLSLLPIYFFVTVVIVFTICPFFWWKENPKFKKPRVYKTYFPYYVTITFGICIFGIIASDFELFVVAFFSSAFITTNQSWLWFAKEVPSQKQHDAKN